MMKRYKLRAISFLLILFNYSSGCSAQEENLNTTKNIRKAKVLVESPATKRVNAIASFLSENPVGLGKVYKDRSFWTSFKDSSAAKVISFADDILKKGLAEWKDEDYLAYFNKNDSEAGKKLLHNRLRGVIILTWAECLTNNGKYTSAINDALLELSKQKSWVNSSSDREKLNYNQKHFEVDLSAATYAHNIAQTLYILDDKIDKNVREIAIQVLHKRVFAPVLYSIEHKDGYNSWLTKTSNWNPVCLSGIVGAALAILPNKYDRAKFIAIAERYIQNYVDGFVDDGYCTEGISYYNFGMTHYIWLREVIWEATSGNVELFNSPKINNMLDYINKIEIVNGIYPAISDCKRGTKPSQFIIDYVQNLYKATHRVFYTWKKGTPLDLVQNLIEFGHSPVNKSSFRINLASSVDNKDLRSYFDKAGVLIVRDKQGSMGAAIKGGNNDEHHNHNDLGSYTIVKGGEIFVEDPGSVPYTAETFNNKRYSIKTIASYGHPVPLVAGKEQVAGFSAQARIKSSDFTTSQDQFIMDLSSGYSNVPSLLSLVRSFTFERDSDKFTVNDIVSFSKKENFETAIITRVKWEIAGQNKILLTGRKEKLLLTIDAGGSNIKIGSEEINDGGLPYSRLRIYFSGPVTKGDIKLVFTPAP